MVKISIIIFSLLFFVSCTTSGPAIFGKQSLHEQYGKKLSNAGLKETALGRSWFTEAEKALSQPLSVTLPFKQRGYFAPDKPRAIGLAFTAKRGSKLVFSLVQNPVNGFVIYGELWRRATNGDYKLLSSLDTAQSGFSYVAEDVSTLILRLQPELLGSGEYTLSIAVEPSLGFPVSGKSARVGSVWGDRRDAGARSHEGIDIFAPKRTPVVASANGTVNRVEETAIGGKVVWLKPDGQPLNLYYAHLDEQLVTAGQNVKRAIL
jgi:murein DD-endopeptidase MepM/ murein hydrolase activator NlpD